MTSTTQRFGAPGARILVHRFSLRAGGTLPDFVLVHGIGVSSRTYGPTAVALARRATVHLLDLPGYGRSPHPAHDPGIGDHARVVADFLVEAGLDHPVLVGHSMGAQVVARLAADRPELVDRIALIGPVMPPWARSPGKATALLLRNGLREPPWVTLMVLEDYVLRAGVAYTLRQARHMLADRIEDTATRVAAKTLILRGADDVVVTSTWARELAARFAHCRLATVPGPHASMFAAPDLITAQLYAHAFS